MSCDASASVVTGVTYCGVHSSAARQDDVESALPAAIGCIDGVAATGLHPSAARHDDARRLRMAGLHQPALTALSSRGRIDSRILAGESYEWKA